MSKNKLHDFTELLAKSQRLASQIGPSDQIRPIHRGIIELDEASRNLAQDGRYTDARAEQSAFRLLAQHTFDAEGLNKEVNSIQLKANIDPLERLESTDIDGFLAHHHDMIILTALDEAKRIVEEDINDMQKRWASEEWSRAKKEFLESLGLRSQGWSGSGSRVLTVQSQSQRPGASDSTMDPSLRPQAFMSSYTAPRTLQSSSSASSSTVSTPLPLQPFLAKHVSVVQQMAAGLGPSSVSSSFSPQSSLGLGLNLRPARDLSAELSTLDLTSIGVSPADLAGYRNCLDLFGGMVGEDSDRPQPSGFFAPLAVAVQLERGGAVEDSLQMRRRLLTQGARRYLERQFETVISGRVQAAVQHGQVALPAAGLGGSRLARLRAFATLSLKSNVLPQSSTQVFEPSDANSSAVSPEPVPLWLLVYLCLRCGALKDAKNVLRQSWDEGMLRSEVEGCLGVVEALVLLQEADQYQSDSSTSVSADLQVLADNMQTCRVQFRDGQHRGSTTVPSSQSHRSHMCPYRLLTLNLLSFSDLDAIASIGAAADGGKGHAPAGTLEDFLWGGLWFVDWSTLLLRGPLPRNRLTSVGSGGDLLSRQSSELVTAPGHTPLCDLYSVDDVYQRIDRAGGERHFDHSRKSPFKYATVLACLQRVGAAAVYLWRGGKTTEAVHLVALALFYGLVLPQVPLEEGEGLGAAGGGASPSPSPMDLLRMWTRHNLAGHPSEAASYALCLGAFAHTGGQFLQGLGEDGVRRNQLLSLQAQAEMLQELIVSLDRSQLSVLLGDVGTDGARTQGHLDRFLDRPSLEMLLSQAGQVLLTRDQDAEGAMHLFQLAGRYADVLTELMRQLVVVFGPAHPQRNFWVAAARGFQQRHMQQGRSIVVNKLEESGRMSVLYTFQTLLNLFSFVDMVVQKRFGDALSLLDELRLLPTSPTEVSPPLPLPLQCVLDDVLLAAMEAVSGAYVQARAQGGPEAGRQARLEALKRRAAGLVSFAGLEKGRLSRSDTASRLARLEVSIL